MILSGYFIRLRIEPAFGLQEIFRQQFQLAGKTIVIGKVAVTINNTEE